MNRCNVKHMCHISIHCGGLPLFSPKPTCTFASNIIAWVRKIKKLKVAPETPGETCTCKIWLITVHKFYSSDKDHFFDNRYGHHNTAETYDCCCLLLNVMIMKSITGIKYRLNCKACQRWYIYQSDTFTAQGQFRD